MVFIDSYSKIFDPIKFRVQIIFICSGCLCHSVFDINVFLAGASGGCYAMIGAHLANIVMVSHQTLE